MRLGGCRLSSSHPAANQKTPFNASRYLLLGLYTFNSLLCASVYYNGPAVSSLLFRDNAFASVCEDPTTRTYVHDERENGKAYICDEQDKIVQNLMPITMASHFVVSAFAGAFLDTFGMRITAVGGMLLHIVAWVLLAFSSPSFNAYYPAFVIMGAACDTAFLPTLVVANLFPGNVALVITLLGSAASLSFAVPAVLEVVWKANPAWTFRHLCVGYIIIGLIPSLLIAMFFMPFKSFIGIDKFEEQFESLEDKKVLREMTQKNEQNKEALAKISNSSRKSSEHALSAAKHVSAGEGFLGLPNLAESTEMSDNVRRRSSAYAATGGALRRSSLKSNSSATARIVVGRDQDGVSRRETEDSRSSWMEPINIAKEDLETYLKGDQRINSLEGHGEIVRGMDGKSKDVKSSNIQQGRFDGLKSLRRQTLSVYFIGITCYFCIVSLAVGYYQEASGSRLFSSEGVKNALRWLGPLSCVPCAILGKCIDIVGLMPIVLLVNTTGVLSYAFAMIGTEATGYFSVLSYCIYLSLFTSQMFCFVEQVFDSKDFGKLVGIITLVGGVISLLSIPLYNDATVSGLAGDPTAICGIFLGLLMLMFFIVGYLWHKLRRNPKPFGAAVETKKVREGRENSMEKALDSPTRDLSLPSIN